MKHFLKIEKHYLWPSCLYSVYVMIFALSVLALLEYKGNGYVYISFTVISNTLLYFGFRKNAIFFDTFIGVFFWLGFWLKTSVRVAFFDSRFLVSIGNFDGSGASFDSALLVTTCGFVGLLTISILREKFIFKYPDKLNIIEHKALLVFYKDNRLLILSGFISIVVIVAVVNALLGIYQRGTIPSTVLPYGLSGIFKWLLLFGCASFTAVILNYEFQLKNKTSYTVVILGLLEGFLTNVSLLSRGMVLNTSALVYGVIKSVKVYSIKSSFRFLIISFFIFLVLFVSSIFLVNQLRYEFGENKEYNQYAGTANSNASYNNYNYDYAVAAHEQTILQLLIDRWVGIEGVMSVVSYPHKGWHLWNDAWKETFRYYKNSFYDENIIISPYRNDMPYGEGTAIKHSISIPGALAFSFYPGSFIFLFLCMFALGLVAALIEFSVYKLGDKNLILCALLSQVIASRYVHFGYVPAQSYLLFGALYLNLFIIYLANKLIIATRRYSN